MTMSTERREYGVLLKSTIQEPHVTKPAASGGLAGQFTAAFDMKDNAEKWATLMKLSSNFEDRSKAYTQIIVMELHMKDTQRRKDKFILQNPEELRRRLLADPRRNSWMMSAATKRQAVMKRTAALRLYASKEFGSPARLCPR